MAEQQAHRNTMLVPILAGLAGAGLALLFAPRSGKETRNMVNENAHETMDAARQRVDAGIAQARDLKNRLQDAVQSSRSKAKQDQDNDQSAIVTSWDQEV